MVEVLMQRGPVLRGGQEKHAAERYELRPADESIKESQRRTVADFLVRHHQRHEFMRLLSLPDERWTFERGVDFNRNEKCTFLGLQRSWMHLERSVPWMPGVRPTPFSERIEVGAFNGFVTDRARIVFCHAGSFAALALSECQFGPKSATKPARRMFNEKYRRNTAVWLDMNCQLCPELRRVANGLSRWLWPFKARIPVVVSFLAARDAYQSDAERVAEFSEWMNQHNKFRAFVVRDVWRHQSAESPYLSVAGTMDSKQGVGA